jgi:PAS domain S-box-containing protein
MMRNKAAGRSLKSHRGGVAICKTGRANAGRQSTRTYPHPPELQLIYDTAPVGLAFLTPDCRYAQINQRLTEICGISVADHIGRTVRETVPQVANQVEEIVQKIVSTGEPIKGIEVHGQRPDKLNADHVWVTDWHPLKSANGRVVGINVVAEDISERKRTQAVLASSAEALRESEGRFRELAENVSQLVWMADRNGRRYWYNQRWYDYTGTTPEEMLAWGWQKIHHPMHRERVEALLKRSFESGTPWEDTFPLRASDGSYSWFLTRAIPIRDEAREVARWFGTNTDVTKQIEAEKELRELKESLEQKVEDETRERLQIWNVSQDLLVVTDLEGRYLSVNPGWTATLGWAETDLLNRTTEWILHPDDLEKMQHHLDQFIAGRKTPRLEVRFRHKDGSYRWISWKSSLDHGRIYSVGRDITEIKKGEIELREARRELGQASRRTTLAAMTAAIAHEIKQPLGAVVTNANAGLRWLNKSPPDINEVRDTLTHIAADGHRASEVIQSVRAMFAGNDQVGQPLDLNDLVCDTIAILRSDLDAADVTVRFALSPLLPSLPGHKIQLQQVVLNIVTNAVEAMRTVSDRARVLTVKSGKNETGGIALAIEDSGTGIEPQHVDRVFEPFFTTKDNGMGMGLAICRSLVEAHGGSLSVSPGLPHGSVVHVVWPSAQ